MIKKRYVKSIYLKELYCDECGEKMLPTGEVLLSFPSQYKYYCQNCGHEETVWEGDGIDKLHYEYDNEEII